MSKNYYETLFILKPTLTEEETNSQIEGVKADIAEQNGEVAATNILGMRKLAYPIDKNERGFYVVIYHKSPGAAIAEIERKLRYNENVLRFLTVKYVNKKEQAEFEKQVANCNGSVNKESEAKEEASQEA